MTGIPMTSVTRTSTFRTLLRVASLTLAVVATFALGVTAAGPQQAGRDDRSAIGSVDFVVVARDGQPITDLTAEEVTLRVANKNRPILSLRFIKVSAGMTGAASAAATSTAQNPAQVLPRPFFTNIATASDTPRSIVLVIDDESMPIGQETKLRAALNNFVRDLPATDAVALVTVPHGGIKVNLTTDRGRMHKAIGEISPIPPMEELSCRTKTTLGTLESTLTQLNRASDQPVIVAFVSTNLTGQSSLEQAQRPTVGGGGGVSVQAGGCHLVTDDFTRVGAALAVARAQLYIIHPDYSQAPAMAGIENLRGQTGAPLFHLASNTEPGLYRMARETAGYYTATFATDPDERTGKALPANIRTTRKEVELRGRPYAVVGRTATTRAAPAAAPVATTAFDMLRSGRMFRDVPLRATATAFRKADGSLNVVGLFEPVDPAVTIVSAAAALVDEKGTGVALWQGEADKMKTWPTAVGLSVPPGSYRLRIAAIDSNGRTGLIDDEIVAVLGKVDALEVSGLVLGVSEGSGFTPRLQFSKEATAVGFVELYGVAEGAEVGSIFEVARTLNGPAFLTVRGEFAATNEDGKFNITAKIPLAALAPGEYVVRALVGAAGRPSVRVVRTLKKVG